jgi:formate dehydrogenase subunit beta
MTIFTTLKTGGQVQSAVSGFLKKMLTEKTVNGILAAAATPYSALPMPTLFTDPEKIVHADPLAPVAPFNTARQAASILRHETGKRLAVVLRPCEIRALIELAKLKQCTLDNTLIIGLECPGRMENLKYLESVSHDPDFTDLFLQDKHLRDLICQSCKACTHFEPDNSDVSICTIGMDLKNEIGLSGNTDFGTQFLKQLNFNSATEPADRREKIKELMDFRSAQKQELITAVREKTNAIEKFEKYFANCINCYNCRTACPVCYCKECVFLTDVFAHDPAVVFRRASKKGAVKLPTDMTMFHMTRMAHMAHACVGCGHCTSVCPSNIPVADIFISVSEEVQKLYEYDPGRDISEPIPLLVFDEQKINLIPKDDNNRS